MRLTGADISSERGGRLVFENVGFSVGDGELLAVVGPNGAGKSTLLRIIAGLLPPTTGTIAIDPEPDDAPNTLMHYLGHRDGLKSAMTVHENLEFWKATGGDDGLSPLDALDAVRLGHLIDVPAGYLSAGQRRRVAVRVHVGHHVVAELLLVVLGLGEVDVVQVLSHLLDLLGRDVEPQFPLGLRQRQPKPPPGGTPPLGTEKLPHGLACVPPFEGTGVALILLVHKDKV